MAHDVFISYSSRDKPIGDAVCANIEAEGIRCWIAPRDIAAGEDWPTAIARAISQSRIMVLVFSASSNSSEDVGRELILAANRKLVIIPFKIENVEPEPGKQYYLARTHWLDAMNPPTREQITQLVNRVKSILPAIVPGDTSQTERDRELPPSLPSRPASTARQSNRWPIWMAGALLILVLCLGAVLAVRYIVQTGVPAIPTTLSASTSAALPNGAPTNVPNTATPPGGVQTTAAPEKATIIPAQLEVTYNPDPAKFQPGGASGGPYTCAYKTTVRAVGVGVRITKFGMYFLENNHWVHSPSNNGQPWSPQDFSDWYSCPGAYIGAGQACSDPNNWSGADTPNPSQGKWYYLGVDDNGNEVQGEAIIECQP